MLIGLDIGGTKIEGVIVAPNTAQVVHRLRVDTPKTNYMAFLVAVKEVIATLLEKEAVQSIGVGCCGSINRATGKMQGANILYLNGQDFLGDLRASYAIPVALTNDANCLAISEFKSGAAKEATNSCLAVIIGTGCGGGVVIHGDIVDGQHGLGGEIGHNPLPGFDSRIDGPAVKCYCGSTNCNESFVSGTGFERTWAIKHAPLSAKEIFAAYAGGDAEAIQHVEYYADCLARVLGTIVNIIDPEVIVLGGGVSNQDVIYPLVTQKLAEHTFSNSITTPIRKALHGDSSGVLGAAYLPVMKGLVEC
ncbi:ROK family protein [Vibrio renipiscarius]|uniref:ROK family transcriptional regulator n=1 Tax=Vibrio renipiscarius TaxID=1461322 RepID=A0A0C2K7M7_9VIBR|nr:ROK family protein [Vibrio renipiscarius]KII76445.1 ROK family transcriptional regulator [Vibrio renipiscarius]KII78033.1 ROK family transcriptional regulator [Vibrio renipiscarius]